MRLPKWPILCTRKLLHHITCRAISDTRSERKSFQNFTRLFDKLLWWRNHQVITLHWAKLFEAWDSQQYSRICQQVAPSSKNGTLNFNVLLNWFLNNAKSLTTKIVRGSCCVLADSTANPKISHFPDFLLPWTFEVKFCQDQQVWNFIQFMKHMRIQKYGNMMPIACEWS